MSSQPPAMPPSPLPPPPGGGLPAPGQPPTGGPLPAPGQGPPKSACKTWAIAGCAVAGGLAVLALLVVAAGVVWWKSAEETELVEADHQAVATMALVDEWFDGWEYSPSSEVWTKVRYPDDSWELDYSYDSPPGEDPIYLQSSLSEEATLQDAKFGYSTLETATRASLSMFGGGDFTIQERPELLSWGDKSTCWLIDGPEGPIGNFFLARKGKRLVLFYCVGMYFDEPEGLGEFLATTLERAPTHAFEGEPVPK